MNLHSALSVFRGMSVLVIGDSGFKGSYLSLWLHSLGARVSGVALPAPAGGHSDAVGLNSLIEHIDADIREWNNVAEAFQRFQPQCVFHLAAQPLVRFSYEQPRLTFETNVGGSLNILEAIRLTPSVRAVIYVTSDKCYLNKEWSWGYRENDELGGRDPYSASKAAAENVFFGYLKSFFESRTGLGAASVRAGNVIGGGDWSTDRLVPDCIRALQQNRPIEVRNPSATRPWQHVLEPVGGYLYLAAHLLEKPKSFSGAWNFGPDAADVRTVGDLASKVARLWEDGRIQTYPPSENQPHEATLLQLNCDKAKLLLGWKPRWGFDRCVSETVRWYKSVWQGEPARQLSLKQISEYVHG